MKLQLEELEQRDMLSVNMLGLVRALSAGHLNAPQRSHPGGLHSAVHWSTAHVRVSSAAVATDTLQAIEISAGNIVGDVRHGATFTGTATGSLPGLWSASINYTPPNPGPNVVNTVVGGSWSLEVVRHGVVRGTLVGNVVGGSATWNSAGTVASISVTLTITGGTGAFVGVTGTGTFAGTLSHLTFPPSISGTLTLRH
jgi:hypothetical protein